MLLPCLQVRVECQSLRDRLKVLQDTQQHDMGALEDRIAELQLQLDEVTNKHYCVAYRMVMYCH